MKNLSQDGQNNKKVLKDPNKTSRQTTKEISTQFDLVNSTKIASLMQDNMAELQCKTTAIKQKQGGLCGKIPLVLNSGKINRCLLK